MKKLFVILIVAALLITALTGCINSGTGNNNGGNNNGGNNGGGDNNGGGNNGGDVTYTLTFAGTSIAPASYKAGAQITQPDDPTKADNVFDGWYIDPAGNEEYTFGAMPASNLTIYAKWIPLTTFTYQLLDEYMRSPSRGSISARIERYLKNGDNYLDGYAVTEINANGNEDISIPAAYNGKPVYVIAHSAATQGTFKKLTIPASVVFINFGAFKDCTNLNEIVFEDNSYITGLGMSAFEGCISLEEVVLPARLVEISGKAFFGCSELTTVYVQHKLDYRVSDDTTPNIDYRDPTYYGVFASSDMFDNCLKLASIYVHLENGNVPVDNELYNGVAEYKQRPGWSSYAGFIKTYPAE